MSISVERWEPNIGQQHQQHLLSSGEERLGRGKVKQATDCLENERIVSSECVTPVFILMEEVSLISECYFFASLAAYYLIQCLYRSL